MAHHLLHHRLHHLLAASRGRLTAAQLAHAFVHRLRVQLEEPALLGAVARLLGPLHLPANVLDALREPPGTRVPLALGELRVGDGGYGKRARKNDSSGIPDRGWVNARTAARS